ncbi:serine/threonine-protein kinase ULK3 isoform X1 [Oncorhynchus kisutch]|uniref:Serine/threonine-protein kinase ULK3 n=1 Tax=Oncorhynchus kisutch TaxID=8019 RepID=A0A8C7MET3_ONCKI|nr:serine/threonine-protein kinase ULK3-like isoform X1 [Oncorhynchus kisutch]
MASSFAPPKLANFILTERLGSGTYATVYKAYRKGDNREVVAVKVVGKKTLNKVSMENLLTEIEILKTVRHPHIVQLKDFQWDSENIYLILEWCSGGDLSRFIHSRRLLPERVARLFLQQIACALQFLHNHNISHLDLKPQNILLNGSVLKLADFGFASYMSPWDEQSALRGSPLYMAPEMVCRRQYDSRVDLWSVGVILYETLFGRAPFASRSYAELEEKIRSDKPIELPAGARVSRNCRDLLLRLLDRDPDTRLTFTQFFSHPWVDLEHMPNAESLGKAKDLVLKAVQKDQEGDRSAALSLYCSSLEHFVPAIHYETDRLRKDALRQKVSQYVSRAEELKALVSADNSLCFEQFKSTRDILREMSRDQPRVLAALELASTAIAMEENGIEDHDTLALYQQSLGELLLVLAECLAAGELVPSSGRLIEERLLQFQGFPLSLSGLSQPNWLAEAQGRRRELLHGEIKSLMTRAEYLKEQMKMLETQKDVSMDREPLSESVRSSCCVQ